MRHRKYDPVKRAQYYQANKQRCMDVHRAYVARNAAAVREYKRQHFLSLKTEVMSAYGGCACVLCGEERIGALTIDHIGGGGNRHRAAIKKRGATFYAWLKRAGFPVGYRVLCSNCNVKQHLMAIKGILATTPVAIKKREAIRATKASIMAALGGKCACGVIDLDLLTVHHTNNDGAEHRRLVSNGKSGLKFYRHLLQTGDYDGLECRCFSCNDATRIDMRTGKQMDRDRYGDDLDA